MNDPRSRHVLNVGGGTRAAAIPDHYNGWRHHLLDIDPKRKPDILLDARDLSSLAPQQYDAVYCSHTLEHFHSHEVPVVLEGFRHVLLEDGFAEIRVPDLMAVCRHMIQQGMDVEDVLYVSPAGPITIRDIFFGYGKEIQASGHDFYAHKTGFTAKSLGAALLRSGMQQVRYASPSAAFEVHVFAFKQPATEEQKDLLGLPDQPAEGA